MNQATTTSLQHADYTPSNEFIRVAIGQAKHLSRVVFDDLFEKDLLGFLLSPMHFHQHLLEMQLYCDQFTTRQLQYVVSDVFHLQEFHKTTLEMFCGTHISECKHKSIAGLMAALDQKCLALPGYKTSHDLVMELNGINQAEIALAWRYRALADGGKSVVQVQVQVQ
jgi:hypothetical protein